MKDIKFFLLDMDGTIYLSDTLIDGAKKFLRKIKDSGRNYVFLTNNSSKNLTMYKEKLNRLGIDANEDDFFTSGSATITYINSIKQNAKIFLLGTKALEEQFIDNGISLVKSRNEVVDFVVLGFDTTLTYEKIWIACDYINAGVEFVATHPDLNCPLEGGKKMPDTGSMIKMFEAATGVSPKIIGKPNKGVVDAVIKKYGYKKEELAIVGDRLYTDIQMAINSEIDSILVLSGETKLDDYKNSTIKPTYVFNSVKEIIDKL